MIVSHTAHDWQNPRNRGRPTRNEDAQPDKPWKEGVGCQRFVVSGSGSGWFEVGRTAAHEVNAAAISRSSLSGIAASRATLTSDVVGHLKTVLQREQHYNTVEEQPRIAARALGNDSFANVSLWLDYTQWHAMFRGYRRDILQALSRLPHPPSHMAAYVLGQGPSEGSPDIVSSLKDEQKISCILGAFDHVITHVRIRSGAQVAACCVGC